MSRTTDFNRIVSSSAVNTTAAKVLGRGVHWDAEHIGRTAPWQDTPLPVLPTPRAASVSVTLGAKVGRLTVVGYGGSGSECARWVVRCACGRYGYQRAKFLNSENAKTRGMCPECNYLEKLKAGDVPPPDVRAALRAMRKERRAADKIPAGGGDARAARDGPPWTPSP